MRRHAMVLAALQVGVVVWSALSGGGAAADDGIVRFNRDVRPILSNKCFNCHGPNAEDREAGLRLDIEEGAKSELPSGEQAVVPGKPDQSELLRRIVHTDKSMRMPPVESGKELTPGEVKKIASWIEQGAQWQGHWAFITPEKPELPAVERHDWPNTPIDHFILARLESEGLHRSPEADRRTLIRRVTLDLIGLPPTRQQVEEFVNDESPNAYEKVVDRLLESPHYGEHRARYWLDAARYGDTHGLHLDNYREMWPYRDWVIDAFNRNMPFDQFTIEQLAGDLLPEATIEQQIASGFNRCHVTTNEGGSIQEEVYVRNVVDRVETTATVFMGLTAGCAVCHDHKFDPLTMKDFYQMFAFFNSLDGSAMDGNRKDPAPVLKVPLRHQQRRIAEIDRLVADLEQQRQSRSEAAEADFQKWLSAASTDKAEPVMPGGLLLHFPLDEGRGDQVASAGQEKQTGQIQGVPLWTDGKFGKAIRIDPSTHVEIGDVAGFERDQAFSYGAWVKLSGDVAGGAVLSRMDDGNAHRGYDLYVVGRKLAMHLIHRWSSDALKVTTKADVLTPNRWQHLFVTYDGSSRAAGVKVYVDGKPQPVDVNVDSLKGTTITDKPLRIGKRNASAPLTGGEVDDVRIYSRRLSESEVATLAGTNPIGPLLAKEPKGRTPADVQQLREHYLAHFDEPYKRLLAEKAKLLAERAKLESQTATTLVFQERAEPRPAYLLIRGQYDQRGKKVERDTPAALPPMKEGLPRNRLGFAKWLTSPEHPLLSRVTVNRFWQQCFGQGIVKTSEDFGSQGEWPSHPELLDWLAVDFRTSGWDVKRLIKMIVMSAAYRQDSRVTPLLLERDPQNRLLARGPRFRLDAEMLRDQALAVSGLLVRRHGGPSVKPPQPDGIWYAVGYTSSNTARFKGDQGDDIYRRSVYTFWKRTAPPPAMSIFDAPSREACRVQRERTNTPLQALVMMNEQQYFEAARHLAQRSMLDAADAKSIAASMFQRATARPPEPDELAELLDTQQAHLAHYQKHPAQAKAAITVGGTPPEASLQPERLAAWTMVANLVLNLDEVINKN